MPRALPVLVGCAVIAVACSGPPTAPTASAARTARLSRTRFLAFGDSLTAGEVTNPVASIGGGPIARLVVVPSASYPAQLQSRLVARYPSQSGSIAVTNAGLAGENLFRAATRFDEALGANLPEAVLIMHGLNNLGADGTDIPTLLIRDMVQTAKSRGMSVFVGSMPPTLAGRVRSQSTALLESYNAKLRQMTIEEGVVFVDLYTTLLPEASTVIGEDGLHPTEAGYRRIADVYLAAIAARLEQ